MSLVSSVATGVDYLRRLAVVLFVVAAAFAIFAIPQQTLELYVIHAQALKSLYAEWAAGRPVLAAPDFSLALQFAFALIAILLLCGVAWLSALRLLLITRAEGKRGEEPSRRHLMLAATISILPVLALFKGFRGAGSPETGSALLAGELLWLNRAAGGLAIVLILLLAFGHLALKGRMKAAINGLFSPRGFVLVSVFLSGIVAAIILSPVVIPETLGTLAIVATFLAILCYVLTAFAGVRIFYGIPVTWSLVILGFVFASYDLSDNHRVDAIVEPIDEKILPHLEFGAPVKTEGLAFIEWLGNRKDRDYYAKKGKPYPVYLVSAEGGGLYAAYHAATFLARMQDECPAFSQHTFAISSVSGGSLGAAVFAGLAQEKAANSAFLPCRPPSGEGEFKSFVDRYFKSDFLSPLVAAALFPDFLQRLFPLPIHAVDRARALERSFEAAWERAQLTEPASTNKAGQNPFAGLLSRIGGAASAAPSLMLHTTSVSLGSRVTLSPLRITSSPTANHISEALLGNIESQKSSVDLMLGAAVSLSARFPWVTPAGWLDRCRSGNGDRDCASTVIKYGTRLYLADGGFFESSGLEAVLELSKKLRELAADKSNFPQELGPIDIRIIQIAAYDNFAQRWRSDEFALSKSGQGELMSPFTALLNTSRARARAVDDSTLALTLPAVDLADDELFNPTDEPRINFVDDIHRVVLDGTSFFLPLGWHLSGTTRHKIGEGKSFWPLFSRCRLHMEIMLEPVSSARKPWEPCQERTYEQLRQEAQ